MDKKIWRCIRKNFLAVAMVAIFIFSGVQGCRVEAAAKPKLNKKKCYVVRGAEQKVESESYKGKSKMVEQ